MVTYTRLYDVIRAIHSATGQVPLRVATQRSDAFYADVQYVEHAPEPTQLELGGKPKHVERHGRVHKVEWRHVQWPEREVSPAVWVRPHPAQGLYQLRHQKRTWLFWDFGREVEGEGEEQRVLNLIMVEVPRREPYDAELKPV